MHPAGPEEVEFGQRQPGVTLVWCLVAAGGQRCVRRMPGRSRGAVYRYRRDRTDAGWKEASRDRPPALSRRSWLICGGWHDASSAFRRPVQPAAGPVNARWRAFQGLKPAAKARRADILMALRDG